MKKEKATRSLIFIFFKCFLCFLLTNNSSYGQELRIIEQYEQDNILNRLNKKNAIIIIDSLYDSYIEDIFFIRKDSVLQAGSSYIETLYEWALENNYKAKIAKEKIEEINRLKYQDIENQYNKLVEVANNIKSKDIEFALFLYKTALKVKLEDDFVRTKIIEIETIIRHNSK